MAEPPLLELILSNEITKNLMTYDKTEIERLLTWSQMCQHYNLPYKKGKNIACPIGTHEDKNPSFSFYGSNKFKCHSCGETGDLFAFIGLMESLDCQSDFGDILKVAANITGVEPLKEKYKAKSSSVKTSSDGLAKYHQQLRGSKDALNYLYSRGISTETIKVSQIGLNNCKLAKGYSRLMIPYFSSEDNFLYYRHFKYQEEDLAPKVIVEKGCKLYPYMPQSIKGKSEVFLCEGEIDTLTLIQNGFAAIGAPGANNWKAEWCEMLKDANIINVCYDNDKPGKEGADKAIDLIKERLPKVTVNVIEWPSEKPEKYDVNDFFNESGDAYEFRDLFKKRYEPEFVPDFCEHVIYGWKEHLTENLPHTVKGSVYCAAVIAQLYIKNIDNPFALVLVDVPSSSKTLTLDNFRDLKITYGTDQFTPASFVSNSSNVKKEDLAKNVDLLPKIKDKALVVSDMATVFSDKPDVLTENLGVLTRVLDGNGLKRNSGVHGERGYEGKYMFVFLAASTPIRLKIWEVMGSIGARLFFFNTNQDTPAEDELIQQITNGSLGEKKERCKKATTMLFNSLSEKYPDGITWNRSGEDKRLLRLITKAACLLAKARGIAKEDKEVDGSSEMFVQSENPSRLNQLLYNFACGHALIHGRTQISIDDVKAATIIAIESAPPKRAKVIRKLLKTQQVLRSADFDVVLGLTRKTTLSHLKKLAALEVIEPIGTQEHSVSLTVRLKPEFNDLKNFFFTHG